MQYYHKPWGALGKIVQNSKRKEIVGVSKENSDGSENVNSMAHCNVCTNEEWILNLGCSYHMCPDQYWFTTYTTVNVGTVLMGNNMPRKTIRIRTIQMRMHDRIVKSLTDVWHVLELKESLFFGRTKEL